MPEQKLKISASDDSEGIVIKIAGEAPKFTTQNWQLCAESYYQNQAHWLAQALCDNLPGGTLDHLIAELMERRASLLRIAHKS